MKMRPIDHSAVLVNITVCICIPISSCFLHFTFLMWVLILPLGKTYVLYSFGSHRHKNRRLAILLT